MEQYNVKDARALALSVTNTSLRPRMKWANIYLACQSHGTLYQSVEFFCGTPLGPERDVELVNPVHRDMVCEVFLGQARFAQEIPLP